MKKIGDIDPKCQDAKQCNLSPFSNRHRVRPVEPANHVKNRAPSAHLEAGQYKNSLVSNRLGKRLLPTTQKNQGEKKKKRKKTTVDFLHTWILDFSFGLDFWPPPCVFPNWPSPDWSLSSPSPWPQANPPWWTWLKTILRNSTRIGQRMEQPRHQLHSGARYACSTSSPKRATRTCPTSGRAANTRSI